MRNGISITILATAPKLQIKFLDYITKGRGERGGPANTQVELLLPNDMIVIIVPYVLLLSCRYVRIPRPYHTVQLETPLFGATLTERQIDSPSLVAVQ